MVSGKTVDAKIKIFDERKVNDFVDWFGKDVCFSKQDDAIISSIRVNEEALIYWALQYGEHVEILLPEETRHKIKERIEEMNKKYQ